MKQMQSGKTLMILISSMIVVAANLMAANVKIRFVDGAGPACVVLNDDDDDDELWDYTQTAQTQIRDDDLVKFKVSTGFTNGTLSIEVENGLGKVKIWADPYKKNLHDMSWDVQNDKIIHKATSPAGRHLGSVLISDTDGDEGYFYVEGISKSFNWDDVTIKVTMGNAVDRINFCVISTDLDVDSDNNEQYANLLTSDVEDQIEASKKIGMEGWTLKRPGKMIYLNKGYTDGVPDWADGFDINFLAIEDDLLEDTKFGFVSLVLTKPQLFDKNCVVKFEYSAADPSSVGFSPALSEQNSTHGYNYRNNSNGNLRIWTKSNSVKRDKNSVNNGGDYVPIGVDIDWSKLNTGKPGQENFVIMYIEGVKASDKFGDLPIKCTITQTRTNSNGGTVVAQAADEVNVSVIDITAEPINIDSTIGGSIPDNSCCVANNQSYYKIDTKPSFPNDKINWVGSMNWELSGAGVGEGVLMKSSGTGNGFAYASIEGGYAGDVQFTGYASPQIKEIPVTVSVLVKTQSILQYTHVKEVGPGETIIEECISDADVDKVLARVNQIWMQAGIRFVKKDNKIWKLTKNSYYKATPLTDTEEHNISSFHVMNESGVELYFVKQLALASGVAPDGVNKGNTFPDYPTVGGSMVATDTGYSTSMLGMVAAHELGHALGLDDIYSQKVDSSGNMEVFQDKLGYLRSHMNDDWTILTPTQQGYFNSTSLQVDAIRKQLMNGITSTADRRDIMHSASTYGFVNKDSSGNPIPVQAGDARVGLKFIISNGYKSNH